MKPCTLSYVSGNRHIAVFLLVSIWITVSDESNLACTDAEDSYEPSVDYP
jgi:hypothetical protein